MASDFLRVTSKRPCRICGQPDFCGYTVSERMSVCMRIGKGASGRTRPSSIGQGWIHIHKEIPISTTYQPTPVRTAPAVARAPLEVRDAIYRELIRISPATRYRNELVDGPNGLRARGLSPADTLNYGALPASRVKRAALAKTLRSFAKSRFPEYADLAGIPGFWQNDKGESQIWTRHDFHGPMLVIPYKDGDGRIHACQIRLHPDDVTSDNPKKYRWLSSPKDSRGASSGTPIHFTFDPKSLPPGSDVVLTEGGLKADTVASLRPSAHLIATSGVSCSHDLLVAAARPYNVLIGFDSDYLTNPAVCAQLASLIAARELDLQTHSDVDHRTTRILSWDGQKGIDDAVKHKTAISVISIDEWLASLFGDSQTAVTEIWRDMGYAKTQNADGVSFHETTSHNSSNVTSNPGSAYRSFSAARPDTVTSDRPGL